MAVLEREEVNAKQKRIFDLNYGVGCRAESHPVFVRGSATAQSSSANYTFLVGSGFLCEAGDSGSCPASAKSTNGDSYEISGAGTFDPPGKSIKAAGTFSHKSPNGNLIETGVWTASELVSFVSSGIAPGALRQHGVAIGPQQFAPKRLPMLLGPMSNRWSRGNPYSPLANVGSINDRSAASELCLGRRAPRTFRGRHSAHFGLEWGRIL